MTKVLRENCSQVFISEVHRLQVCFTRDKLTASDHSWDFTDVSSSLLQLLVHANQTPVQFVFVCVFTVIGPKQLTRCRKHFTRLSHSVFLQRKLGNFGIRLKTCNRYTSSLYHPNLKVNFCVQQCRLWSKVVHFIQEIQTDQTFNMLHNLKWTYLNGL